MKIIIIIKYSLLILVGSIIISFILPEDSPPYLNFIIGYIYGIPISLMLQIDLHS